MCLKVSKKTRYLNLKEALEIARLAPNTSSRWNEGIETGFLKCILLLMRRLITELNTCANLG